MTMSVVIPSLFSDDSFIWFPFWGHAIHFQQTSLIADFSVSLWKVEYKLFTRAFYTLTKHGCWQFFDGSVLQGIC